VATSATTRALVAALLAPAGCFYTTNINQRPSAEIRIETEGPHYAGKQVYFSAVTSDSEDGDNLRCMWTAQSCEGDGCERTVPIPDVSPAAISCGQLFGMVLPDKDHRSVLVRVVVTDQAGGDFTASQILEVANQVPTVEVQVRPAGTADHAVVNVPVRASVQVADLDGDVDDLILTWRLIKPRGGGVDVELIPAPAEGDELGHVFTPDLPGLWMVEVTADDGIDQGVGSGAAAVEEDGAPCLGLTAPEAVADQRLVVRREDGPRTFAVLVVADDLDPYPGPHPAPGQGEPTFSWQLASPDTGGELAPVSGAVGPELVVDPSAFAPGDLLDVRVEVGDRIERLLQCDVSSPTCSLDGDPTCLQRASWGVEIR
jgi:hypothetical protein